MKLNPIFEIEPKIYEADTRPIRLPLKTEEKKVTQILVVDDEADLAMVVSRMIRLTYKDANILTALNGLEAQELIKTHKMDLIISDVNMPGVGGLELYHWVKNFYPELTSHFFFMTADSSDFGTASQLEKIGLTVLRKPFEMKELHHACQAALV